MIPLTLLIDHTLREIVGDANAPSSTIRQHEFLKTQILYTTCSQTNLWESPYWFFFDEYSSQCVERKIPPR